MNSISRAAASRTLNSSPLEAGGDNNLEHSSGQNLQSNTFSFRNLFSPVLSHPKTPSGVTQWSSKVASFVGTIFDRKTPSELENVTIEDHPLGKTIVCSSPELVRVTSSPVQSLDSLTSSNCSFTEESTLPEQGFFQAGDQDKKKLITSLLKKLKEAQESQDPEEQLKKDIGRFSYFLNEKKVDNIETIKTFLGKAAEGILPILSQTIPNTATDIIVERILNTAPVDTVHAELAMSDDKSAGTSIFLTQEEGNPNFQIRIDSIGVSTVFLKKIQQADTSDFEIITLDKEARHSEQKGLSGEAQQFILLELKKDDAGNYAMSCSALVRKYQINPSATACS